MADNTIFQDGDLSDGAGQFLFSGQANAAAFARRALLKFDIGGIPAGSHIDSASLTLHVSKVRPLTTSYSFGVHRMTSDWGEGTSDGGLNEGTGAAATAGDATWNFSFFSTNRWNNVGGDFTAAASATASVGDANTFATWSGAQLTADVQRWLDNPASQLGWMIKEADESIEGSAKRFDSRESPTVSFRPKLTINYTPGATNDPPTLDTLNDVSVQEDASQQTVDLTGISPGPGETQAVAITATSNNPGLIPNPSVVYTSPNSTGALTFTPVANQSGSARITVTVRDAGSDGIAGNADDASILRTFTVTVNPVNDLPSLNAINNPAAITEDAPQQTVNLSGITAGPGENQPLEVTASSSNPSLIPNPTVTYTTPSSAGSLSYTSVANQSGSATITVTVRDGGLDGTLNTPDDGTVSRSFTVTVNPVNDPPTLDAVPNPAAIAEDSTQQTINLTGISAGPGETQSLSITATSGNTALLPNPSVTYTSPGATGTLHYTPVANQSGSATVTVTVRDAGLNGTPGDGDDATFVRTFTVSVAPVNDPPTLDAISSPAAILEDAGQQTINFSGIAAGGGETQTLLVTATSSVPTLIPNPTVTYTSPGATGSLAYTPAANQSGSATITVTVRDAGLDGTIGNGDDGTFSRTFTVAVNPIDDPPTLDAIASPPAIQENAGAQTVGLTGITAGPSESQTLFVSASSDNPALIPNPSVTYTSPNPTGSISYTPAAGQNGSAVITVTVRDSGADGTPGNGDDLFFSRQFTVLVNAPNVVNQTPSFAKGPNVSATDEDSGRTFAAWATNISAGPPSEAAQSLNFIVSNNDNGLFLVQPAIDSTGKLTFTPAPNAHGVAVVSAQIHDNGGTANGGVDTSAVQTFNITITKPHVWHNTLNGRDVTGDGHVVARDALEVINYLNGFGPGAVPANAPFGPNYFDVNNDGAVAPGDALDIINFINGGLGGEGEPATSIQATAADALYAELGLLASINVPPSRRRV